MRQGQAAHTSRSDAEATDGQDRLAIFASLLIGAAVILGGASRENPFRLAAVELAALPVLALGVRRVLRWDLESFARMAGPLGILLLILAVPVLQLAPLPPGVWTALPGQGARVEALRLADRSLTWLPASLAPRETLGMALAVVPPAAMFLGVATLPSGWLRRLSGLWIVLAIGGLILGLGQIATPAGGPAYPYETTNLGSLVGLFANRNHEAAFLLALVPLAAALASRTGAFGRWGGGLFILAAVVALGVIRSRAGVILAGPAIAGAVAIGAAAGGERSARWPAAGLLAIAAVAAAGAVALFAAGPILDRFAPGAEFRFEAWPYVATAARAFLPLGSGLGSFDRVFQSVEPLALVAPAYFNHAHNDYLELWLETGWAGAAILGLFLLWFLAASLRAWRSGDDVARAASVAVSLLLAQSAVDYPLRTETLAVLFAFCCGLLAREGRRA